MLRKGQGRPRAEEGIGFLPTPRPTYHLQLQPRVRLKGPCLLRTPPHTLPPLWAPVLRNKVRVRPGGGAGQGAGPQGACVTRVGSSRAGTELVVGFQVTSRPRPATRVGTGAPSAPPPRQFPFFMT